MVAMPIVLRTEPYDKAFREKQLRCGSAHLPVTAERFVWMKADMGSRHAYVLHSAGH
jgi:hypothetical protein